MSRFKPGQKVTPKVKPRWVSVIGRVKYNGPAFGEIVTVEKYHPFDHKYVQFCEYGVNTYFEDDFEPLVSDAVLFEALEEITETEKV